MLSWDGVKSVSGDSERGAVDQGCDTFYQLGEGGGNRWS